MRIASMGHAFFAAVMLGLGILGLASGGFVPIWGPVPKGWPAREMLAYLCALVPLVCGVGLAWQRTAPGSARLLLAWLLLGWLALKVPPVFSAPMAQDSWSNCGEGAVYAAGAWVLYAWFAKGRATGDKGVRIARTLYALALIPFGIAHFSYVNETASLVPAWLPWHLAWAYFTGGAYIAAAISMLTGVKGRLAAVLSALMMGVFTVLVWVPIMMAAPPSAFTWSEFVISIVLTAAAWVVADSYRAAPNTRNRLEK